MGDMKQLRPRDIAQTRVVNDHEGRLTARANTCTLCCQETWHVHRRPKKLGFPASEECGEDISRAFLALVMICQEDVMITKIASEHLLG